MPNYTLLSANTHPDSVQAVTDVNLSSEHRDKISYALLSMNPAAEEYLLMHPWIRESGPSQANPAPHMVNSTRRCYANRKMTSYISWNSHEWAVEYTRTHPELID